MKNKKTFGMSGSTFYGKSPLYQRQVKPKPTVLKYEKDADDFIARKNNEKKLKKNKEAYNQTLATRTSVDNKEHKGNTDSAIEAMKNDHDVDDNGVPQTGAAEYYKKTGKKPKKGL